MDHIPTAKKPKNDCNGESNQSPDKRKQVDAHVQAFLKAVLEHAHNGSAQKTDKPAIKKKPVIKKDASTQTEASTEFEYESYSYHPDEAQLNDLECDKSEQTSNFHHNISRVPNREMYSQEALNLLSQQNIYSDQAQEELFTSDDAHYYSTESHLDCSDQNLNPKSSRISSSKIKRAINEWVKKYEDWFFQNFGMDVRTASHSFVPQSGTEFIQQNPETIIGTSQTLTCTVPPISQVQNNCVVSHAPVSYIVPEGSLCTLDDRFSPYYSLVPSFYIAPAFSNTQFGLHSGATSFDFGARPFFYPNPLSLPTFVPVTICTPISNTVIPFSQNVHHQSIASMIPVQANLATPVTAPIVTNSLNTPISVTPNHQPTQSITSFADLPSELQTSAMLATLALPVGNNQNNLGQWGPQLKYGTYGRLPSPLDLEAFNVQKQSSEALRNQTTQVFGSSSDVLVNKSPADASARMPPPPPTFILLRRQAMICALQLSCRERGHELFLREKESFSGLPIDFVKELSQVVDGSIGLSLTYIFTRISDLSSKERSFFIKSEAQQLSNGNYSLNTMHSTANGVDLFDINQLYACDLLIGDVLVAESLSVSKSLAQVCAARQAFQILSRPCFLVGSIRQWEEVEYLVLCLSPKAEIVPKLPPFLKDPFEVNYEKSTEELEDDTAGNNTTVFSPKPFEDMWIYLARLPKEALSDQVFSFVVVNLVIREKGMFKK
uniref:Uncharacterized protein n=1 Tax=Trichobilharzia regenti TaxID=157069 RepID=A0AA85KM92_TRIRE|nr:unnamed protein product [Trichobilharzia regenti]